MIVSPWDNKDRQKDNNVLFKAVVSTKSLKRFVGYGSGQIIRLTTDWHGTGPWRLQVWNSMQQQSQLLVIGLEASGCLLPQHKLRKGRNWSTSPQLTVAVCLHSRRWWLVGLNLHFSALTNYICFVQEQLANLDVNPDMVNTGMQKYHFWGVTGPARHDLSQFFNQMISIVQINSGNKKIMTTLRDLKA